MSRGLRLSHKIAVTLGVGVLGLTGFILAFASPRARNQAEIFPQNQDCQPDAVALRVRLAYPRAHWRSAGPSPEPQTRSVTNCRRMWFQFFLNTLELTTLHFGSIAGSIWEKLYGLNGKGERDLIVHVSHLQPAVSITDPTISTNLTLLTFEHSLQHAYARFDGTREPLEGYSLDRFRPYDAVHRQYGRQDDRLFFLSRLGAAVELVGMCQPDLSKEVDASSWCKVLAYSPQDGLAFGVLFPHAELGKLEDILERTLGLIRSWRLQAIRFEPLGPSAGGVQDCRDMASASC
jgi:hypothetical protein